MRIPWAALRHVWNINWDNFPAVIVLLLIVGVAAWLIYYFDKKEKEERQKKELEKIIKQMLVEDYIKKMRSDYDRQNAIDEMYWIRR